MFDHPRVVARVLGLLLRRLFASRHTGDVEALDVPYESRWPTAPPLYVLAARRVF
jgi:hypothetical protein